MTLEEGQILFREGDPGENLYVVRDGELQGKSTLGTAINTYGPGRKSLTPKLLPPPKTAS